MQKNQISLAVVSFLVCIVQICHAEPNCSDILRYGLFDEGTYQKDKTLREEYEHALCNTSFESFQDAQSYGIGVGVPIYGVPVQISGTMSSDERRQWQSKHCSSTRNKRDFRDFVFSATKKASPLIVEAWARCAITEIEKRRSGLKCELAQSGDNIVFTAFWAPAYKNDKGPAVSFAGTFGGDCSGPVSVRSLDQKQVFTCKRKQSGETVSFLVETETERCFLAMPQIKNECTVRRFKAGDNGSDKNVISGDTDIRCASVIFEAGTVLRVSNGAQLRFLVTDSIAIQGDGGAIIDGTGEPGKQGKNAADRSDVWTSQGDDDYWRAVNDVKSKDSHPDRGLRGDDGGKGGAGATIIFSKAPSGQVTCKVDGGPGGNGGSGGKGKLLRNGRQFYCDGCMYDRRGPDGNQGPAGDKGACLFLERTPEVPTM